MEKKAAKVMREKIWISWLEASRWKGKQKEAVKAMTLKLLNDKYGIEEEDFLSAELEDCAGRKSKRDRPGFQHDHGIRPG